MSAHKTLILCRHSDAEGENKKGDFYRKLTQKGEKKALQTANWLKEQNVKVSKTVCSESVRTQETYEIFKEVLGEDLFVKYENKIYDNNYLDINRCIMKECDEAEAIMIIGHNPSMSHLATHYAEIYRFPTAGCVILKFEAESWNQLDPIFLHESMCNFEN